MSPTCDKLLMENKISFDEVKQLNDYFKDLINKIPPKIFFNKNEQILQTIENAKRKKFANNSELSDKSKHKRVKLDPSNQQRVSDVAQEFVQQKESDGKINELRKKLAKRIKDLRDRRTGGKNVHQTIPKIMDNDDANSEISLNKNKPKIFNEQGNLVFSKFDLTSQVDLSAEREMTKDRELKKQHNKTSLQGLLIKAEKDERKVSHLQATNSKAAEKFKKARIWQTVLEKSEGNKVRDDPQLIKKSLKKQQKKKSKNFKVWNERKESVKKRQQSKQDRRQRMLEERKNKKEKRSKRYLKKNK